MSDLYWLTDEQMARLEPFFPKSHGKPRVDDRRVLSGIIFVNRNGLRWRDAPAAYGPHKTLYNRWKRWSEAGVFIRMMEGLSGAQTERRTVMIDATYLKAHRTASSLRVKKGSRATDRTHERRHEHQASRRDRCERKAHQPLHDSGSGQRLHRRCRSPGQPAPRPVASGRPRLRRRLVPGRLAGQGDHAVHPRPQNPHRTHPLRQATLQSGETGSKSCLDA